MKKIIYFVVGIMMAVALDSCRNDWTIKDMPPVPDKADGAGYVAGFESETAGIVIPVEVSAPGSYTIVVRGRSSVDGVTGTGMISAGASSASVSFPQAYVWGDCQVALNLEAGVNQIVISGEGGNGNFQVDYIEVKQ